LGPQEEKVRDYLTGFGFGATIEITNGMGDAYGKKAKQALRAKDFLEGLTEDKVRIATGLAYLVSKREVVDPSFHINATISVSQYNPSRLENVLTRLWTSNDLSKEEAAFIEKIHDKADEEWDLPGFFAGHLNELKKRARYLDLTFYDYKTMLSVVKGFVMELYISSLFEDEIEVEERFFFSRLKFPYQDEKCYGSQKKTSDADLVIVCKENRFYGALQRLNTRPEIQTKILTRKKR
jgi:hypothetical protein